jgi:GT2 family glycosyltransferase
VTVAVVTPWHNHLELRPDYERALELGPRPDELVIVDNGSDPPLGFATIRLDRNTGFSHASNVGLRHATAEIVVFLNNDIAAHAAGWLAELTDRVEPGVLAGARMRYEAHAAVDGQVIPYLDGWCLAGIRDELLELGGFDETLAEPAYYSDNLLCLRARAAGTRLREVRVGVEHKLGVTADPALVAEAIRTNRRLYEQQAQALLVATERGI